MSDYLKCSRILSIMVILSFMVQYMLRVNISIAIVEMVFKNDSKTNGPRYNWNENQKNDILGIFFWGYIITQIPAGRFSEIFGTKIVVGTGVLIASLLTVLVPLACNLHYYLIAVLRFCIGMSLGVLWPSIPPMAAKWSSSTGTSMFMSHMFASALGAALTLPVCGYLIDNLGWPTVFYVTGGIGLIWTTAWFYLVYDTPAQHPRINVEERENLERRNTFNVVKNYETPWTKILTSAPVWAFVVCNISGTFVTYFVLNHLPTYLDQILHFNIKQNGWLSALPNIAKYTMAVVASYVSERLLNMKIVSKITIRKSCTTLMFGGATLVLAGQAVWGDSRLVSILVFTSCFCLAGLGAPGYFSNSVDLSPSYSGTIFGVAQVPGSATGFVLAKLISLIVKDSRSFDQWKKVFWFLAGFQLFACVIYLTCASSSEQSWNPKRGVTDVETLKSDDQKDIDEIDNKEIQPIL